VAMGPAAVSCGEHFCSELDLLLEVLDVLVKIWDGKRVTSHIAGEFNRRVTKIYDSVLSFHALVDLLFRRDAVSDHPVPRILKEEMDLFSSCARLHKVDDRFPKVDLWISLMAQLNICSEFSAPIDCKLDAIEFASFASRQLQNIDAQVSQLPSHLEFVNQRLSRFWGTASEH
jgi:hypothetical protein